MQPVLIAIRSNNKTAVYSYIDNGRYAIYEAEIGEFAGRLYYTHKGRNFPLPAEFQCKKPVFKH